MCLKVVPNEISRVAGELVMMRMLCPAMRRKLERSRAHVDWDKMEQGMPRRKGRRDMGKDSGTRQTSRYRLLNGWENKIKLQG